MIYIAMFHIYSVDVVTGTRCWNDSNCPAVYQCWGWWQRVLIKALGFIPALIITTSQLLKFTDYFIVQLRICWSVPMLQVPNLLKYSYFAGDVVITDVQQISTVLGVVAKGIHKSPGVLPALIINIIKLLINYYKLMCIHSMLSAIQLQVLKLVQYKLYIIIIMSAMQTAVLTISASYMNFAKYSWLICMAQLATQLPSLRSW